MQVVIYAHGGWGEGGGNVLHVVRVAAFPPPPILLKSELEEYSYLAKATWGRARETAWVYLSNDPARHE